MERGTFLAKRSKQPRQQKGLAYLKKWSEFTELGSRTEGSEGGSGQDQEAPHTLQWGLDS